MHLKNKKVWFWLMGFFSSQVKKKAEMEKSQLETLKSMTEPPLFTTTPLSLAATVASVTTGQPTINVATSSVGKINSSNSSNSSCSLNNGSLNTTNVVTNVRSSATKAKRPVSQLKKIVSSVTGTHHIPETNAHKQTRNRKHAREHKKLHSSAHNGVIAYADVSETIGGSQEAELITFVANKFRHKGPRADCLSSVSDTQSAVNGSTDGSSSSSSRELKASDAEDEDVEVDIDIENDDSENAVLLSRSASPSSVYQQLLRSAEIGMEHKSGPRLQSADPASNDGSEMEEPVCSLDDSGQADSGHSSDKVDSLVDSVARSENSSEDYSKDKQEDEEDQAKTEAIGGYVSCDEVSNQNNGGEKSPSGIVSFGYRFILQQDTLKQKC